ncbi:MAG: hypothetical protein EA356_02690 [Geminicoccaceae bacterium]|nr:MAG: hypothetical protein EA356_02690 [Geminicoccaceae bacterium]
MSDQGAPCASGCGAYLTLMTSIMRWVAGAFLVLSGWAGAEAQVVQTERVKASLVSEVATVAPGDTVWVGLHLDIIPGWHTYWKNPGDSGAATNLDWQLLPGVVAGPIQWPLPEAVPYGPLMNFGYYGEVLHLVEVSVPADWPLGEPVPLEADALWLVCADICIPESGTVGLSLATGPETLADPATLALFDRFKARLPQPSPFDLTASGPEPLQLTIEGHFDPALLQDVRFFPAESGRLNHPAAQPWEVRADGLVLHLPPGRAPPAERLEGVLVLTEALGPQHFEQALIVDLPMLASAPGWAEGALRGGAGLGLLAAVLLALAGGVLLNLMPCVFPVLSMKALALVEVGGSDRATLRRHGLLYLAGVLVTFAAVAGALIALRAGGAQIGWGFQLQSPVVVALLAYVLFVVGLNLSGLFALNLTPNVGGSVAARPDGLGAFATGLLAVVVATPCTAPFMAAALGFALTQPAHVTLAVFLALGVGLALPFLLVTWVPGMGRRLPRPGPWMTRLRQGLAFPMYASAAWLVWVLAQQAGPDAVLAVLVGAVLLAFGLWLAAPALGGASRTARLGGAVAGVVALALLTVPATSLPVTAATGEAEPLTLGERFDPERLAEARAAGEPVFVHLTAAWCITCQVNERVALSGRDFERLLTEHGITYFVGDWTNRDAVIADYLRRYDHPGVPLYVVYGANGAPAQVLPQVLTPSLVRTALRNAAAG